MKMLSIQDVLNLSISASEDGTARFKCWIDHLKDGGDDDDD